jgi:hypothetical protein
MLGQLETTMNREDTTYFIIGVEIAPTTGYRPYQEYQETHQKHTRMMRWSHSKKTPKHDKTSRSKQESNDTGT